MITILIVDKRFVLLFPGNKVIVAELCFQVFQRRQDGSVDFYRDWNDYENGFGEISSEHWLGNEKIHRITAQAQYELRIDLTDFDGDERYTTYSNFGLGNADTKYSLISINYVNRSGDAGKFIFFMTELPLLLAFDLLDAIYYSI